MSARLEVNDVTVVYESGGYAIKPLDHLSFEAEDGELVVLLGPSGSGKTTLLSCLAGHLTPTTGQVMYGLTDVTGLHGHDLLTYRRQTVGVVFQAFNLIPSLSARGNVIAPLRLAGQRRGPAKKRADELLAQVGLARSARRRPARLTGGQQQRVAIARALVHDPQLILADEPTAHLDHIEVEGVLALLRDLAGPGRMVVVSTHDDRFSGLADRVIELAPHYADEDRPPEKVTLEPGDLLFRQGDMGALIYFVDSGLLEAYRERVDGSEEILTRIEPGNYVGELGPVLHLPRSASLRAVEESVVTGYTVPAFRRSNPHVAG